MSGRVLTILSDARQVRGYRKTLRRVQSRPVRLVQESSAPPVIPAGASPEYPVRLTFMLPETILISAGPHGFNVMVLPGNVVRIRGRGADHCFALARNFFGAIARERAGFTCHASISRDDDTRTYGRHLTVVEGALVISGGMIEPRVYDAAQVGR
jgi:hypothetical protein